MNTNGHQPHILCIDHSPEILDLLRSLLEDEGFRVSTLLTLDRSVDTVVELNPDVITLDYMWTHSDDEWTYLNLLTMDPRTRNIPVIVCTAAVSQATEAKGHLETIGVKVIFKPFDIEDFLAAVQECLGRDASIAGVIES